MEFSEPVSAESDTWPFIISPGAGRDTSSTPRLLCNGQAKAENVTAFSATVNLNTGQVEELGDSFRIHGRAKGPFIEFGDIGPLPEEYRSVPGY
jgi:hypothetical protein